MGSPLSRPDPTSPASVAEALSTRALVSQQQGGVQVAEELYEEAAAIAASAGATNARLGVLFHHGLMRYEHDRAAQGLAQLLFRHAAHSRFRGKLPLFSRKT